MDIRVPLAHLGAAVLSQLVQDYIGLWMSTSIRAITERILLHCSLTSTPGHHAPRRWIVEKAVAAMHDAMHNEVTNILYMTMFIALLLDGFDSGRGFQPWGAGCQCTPSY